MRNRLIPGGRIIARPINLLGAGVGRLLARSGRAGVVATAGHGSESLRLDTQEKFIAQLSGTSSPYGITEVYDTPGGGHAALGGGRSCSACAYEDNAIASLGGKYAEIRPGPVDGEYRFSFKRFGTGTVPCKWPGPCDVATTNYTLTVTYYAVSGCAPPCEPVCSTTTTTLTLTYQGTGKPWSCFTHNFGNTCPTGNLWATSCWTPTSPFGSFSCNPSCTFQGPCGIPATSIGQYVWVFEMYCPTICPANGVPTLSAYAYYPAGSYGTGCQGALSTSCPRCCSAYPNYPPSSWDAGDGCGCAGEDQAGLVSGEYWHPAGICGTGVDISLLQQMNFVSGTISPLSLEYQMVGSNGVTPTNTVYFTLVVS